MRLLARRGLIDGDAEDTLACEAPALSACYEGAVTQRVGLGPVIREFECAHTLGEARCAAAGHADPLLAQGCDDGFPVQFCEFDGGHLVPTFTGEAVWKFFSRF